MAGKLERITTTIPGADKLSASWVLVVGAVFIGYWYYKTKPNFHPGIGSLGSAGASYRAVPAKGGGLYNPAAIGGPLPGGGPPTDEQMKAAGGSVPRSRGGAPPVLPWPAAPYQRSSLPFDIDAQIAREVG